MRIGLVAKGLLIKGDMDVELVLMCRDKPTEKLLDTVCLNLPTQIQVGDCTVLTNMLSDLNVFFLFIVLKQKLNHADNSSMKINTVVIDVVSNMLCIICLLN